MENSLTSNILVDSSNNSQATPEEKAKKCDQSNISLGETEWKILKDILRKGVSHPFPVSLSEEYHSLIFPICLHFSEREDGDKQG